MSKRTHTLPLTFTLVALVTSPVLANVTGNDTQNFNPVSGGADFVTVESSTVLAPGRFSLGLFFNQATNTLPYESDEHQSRAKVNDSLIGMDMAIGVGLLPGLELSVAFPFLVDQSVKKDDTRGEFAKTGNTEVKPVLKYSFLNNQTYGLAVVASANVNRLQDDPQTGVDTSPIYNFEVAGDRRVGRTRLGLNVGYRARKAGEEIDGSLVEPFSNEAIASTALSYNFRPKTAVVGEIFGSRVLQAPRNETDRDAASAEFILGLRHRFNDNLVGHIGAGTELMHGFSTPDWRIYAGLATEIGAKDEGRTIVKKKKKKKAPAAEFAPEPTPEDLGDGGGLAAIPEQEPDEVFVLHNINFEFDSDYRVLPGARAELDKLMTQLNKHPFSKLVIEGHTDFYGSDEYNDDLSKRRSKTVRHQLIKYYSVEPEKVVSVGYGEYMPMTDDMSDAGRQLNRRVEIKVYWVDNAAH